MRAPFLAVTILALVSVGVSDAAAEWLRPDPSYQQAEQALRFAAHDTMGRPNDAALLDSLGVALLRLGRRKDAETIFGRVLALAPRDPIAAAGLGKLALFQGRLAAADTLLASADPEDRGASADRMNGRLRSGDFAGAAALAPAAGVEGRVAQLERMAADGAWVVRGPATRLIWKRAFPIPLVRAKVAGHSVLLALDTGAGDLLLDQSVAKRAGIAPLPGQSLAFWDGSRVSVRHAIVPRIELGDARIEKVPAGILQLHKWGQMANPLDEPVAGVIGLNLLRRFTPTIDFDRRVLELNPAGSSIAAGPDAARVPFEIWGEHELTVYGSIAGGRRMAFVLATGLPGAGVGAPSEVMEEVGVKPGGISRLVKGAGSVLSGHPWYEVSVPSVSVGPLARDRVAGWSGALESAELWRHGVRRDALLGGEFFKDRRVTIDWQKSELVVESAK